MLHNNAINIGLDMSKVKLPKLCLNQDVKTPASSIFNYLGVKKFKKGKKVNAVPFLGVRDIFKNYYANKQEESFYMIKNAVEENDIAIINGNEIQGSMIAKAGTIETQDAQVQVVTGISPEDINLGNSYIELAPIKWTEGSGITQYMRAEVSLLDCELEHEKKTLPIS